MLTPIFLETDELVGASLADTDGAAVTAATVTAIILRPDGSQVGDMIPMSHTGGGAYIGAIPSTLELVEGELLDIKISAVVGTTRQTMWVAARAQKQRVVPTTI